MTFVTCYRDLWPRQRKFRQRVSAISCLSPSLKTHTFPSSRKKHSIRSQTAPICDFHTHFSSSLRRRKVASCNPRTIPFVRVWLRSRLPRSIMFFHARNNARTRGDTLIRAWACLLSKNRLYSCRLMFCSPELLLPRRRRLGQTTIFHYTVG